MLNLSTDPRDASGTHAVLVGDSKYVQHLNIDMILFYETQGKKVKLIGWGY